MKKILLSIWTLFFFVNCLFSQEEKGIYFGVNVNPKLTIQKFDNKDLATGENSFSYSIGGDIYYVFNAKFELKSGISISRMNVNQIDYSLTFDCDFDGSQLDQFNTYTKEDYSVYYLGIPIEGRAKLVGGENHLYLKMGIESLIKIGNSNKAFLIECDGEPRESDLGFLKELERTIFKLKMGIGYETKLFQNKKFYIEPQVEYYPTKLFNGMGTLSDLTNDLSVIEIGIMFGVKL